MQDCNTILKKMLNMIESKKHQKIVSKYLESNQCTFKLSKQVQQQAKRRKAKPNYAKIMMHDQNMLVSVDLEDNKLTTEATHYTRTVDETSQNSTIDLEKNNLHSNQRRESYKPVYNDQVFSKQALSDHNPSPFDEHTVENENQNTLNIYLKLCKRYPRIRKAESDASYIFVYENEKNEDTCITTHKFTFFDDEGKLIE